MRLSFRSLRTIKRETIVWSMLCRHQSLCKLSSQAGADQEGKLATGPAKGFLYLRRTFSPSADYPLLPIDRNTENRLFFIHIWKKKMIFPLEKLKILYFHNFLKINR